MKRVAEKHLVPSNRARWSRSSLPQPRAKPPSAPPPCQGTCASQGSASPPTRRPPSLPTTELPDEPPPHPFGPGLERRARRRLRWSKPGACYILTHPWPAPPTESSDTSPGSARAYAARGRDHAEPALPHHRASHVAEWPGAPASCRGEELPGRRAPARGSERPVERRREASG